MATAAPSVPGLETRRMAFEGLSASYHVGGQGKPLLLLHGSGPGASTIGNWRTVLPELVERHRVIAMDLIGFGLSDRRPEPPYFDVALWLRQARAALDLFEGGEIGVVGHSISGALALRLAAEDRRVTRVMTTGTMGGPMPVNPHLRHVWRCPATRDAMREAAGVLIRDTSLITDAYLDARMAIIGSEDYRAYFDAMFAGPFEPFIAAARLAPETLRAVTARVLMLHGRDDRAFPAEHNSVALLPDLARADLWLLSDCSHSVAMERRDAFMAAVGVLFG